MEEKDNHLVEALATEAAFLAVLGVADREGLVLGAHVVRSRPSAATLVVDRVNVEIAARQRALEQVFAGLRRDVPPTFRRPALLVLIPQGNANTACGRIAQLEIRVSRGGDEGNDGNDRQTCGGIMCHCAPQPLSSVGPHVLSSTTRNCSSGQRDAAPKKRRARRCLATYRRV